MNQHQAPSILLVEDDKNANEILSAVLTIRFPQATIYSAGDGKVGLESFKKYLPDIVITDISMPEMDGTGMIRKIPAIKPETRIIVATAHNDWNNLDIFALTGVYCDFVRKPIDFDALFAAVERGIAVTGSHCVPASAPGDYGE